MSPVVIALLGKGGAGKTTSAAALADALARRGEAVLLIDLDAQTSLSDWLAPSRGSDASGGLYGAVLGNRSLSEVIVPLRASESLDLDLLPAAGPDLIALEHHIDTQQRQREMVLAKWLNKAAKQYSVVVMDTPRGLVGPLSLNALEAADGAILPMDPTGMGLDALREQVALVEAVGEDRGLDLLAGVLPTRVSRTRLASVALTRAEESGYPLLTAIPMATAVAEAVLFRQLLAEYAPGSPATQAYEEVAEEVLTRVKG